MPTYLQHLKEAKQKGHAIGHFNFSTIEVMWAIINAAKELEVPVILGMSEGERDFFGEAAAIQIVKHYRQSTHHPVFLNADHTFSLERIKQVVDLGYDSVIVDGAKLDFNTNVKLTLDAVTYTRSINPDILVEAEIGYIGTSSSILDELPQNAAIYPSLMPTVEEVTSFVRQTNIDLISVAVGNIHGMLKNAPNPRLNYELIQSLTQALNIPLVLHGGSGLTNEDFTQAVHSGISLIHINTDIRRAWKEALVQTVTQTPNEVAPYKLLKPSQNAVQQLVKQYLKLFSQST